MRLKNGRLWQGGKPWKRLDFEPETVLVEAGEFWMGSEPGKGISLWETPSQKITLPEYRIGKFPVTNREYAEFIQQCNRTIPPEAGWNGLTPPHEKLDHPVVGVSWYDALAYCQWLTEKTERVYTLPSEAEWEKAARGNEEARPYPWGEWQEKRCNHNSEDTTPIDAFPQQSDYGCYDMVGNVREWTSTLWGTRQRAPDPQFYYPWATDGRENLAASKFILRVHRGGAASDPLEKLRCSARAAYFPDKTGPPRKRHGFRVVMKLQDNE
jgi:iron(II)-dependent oxidoreductase